MIIERRGDWRGGIKDWEAPPSEASNDGSLPLRDGDPVVLRSILASSWLLLLFSSISGGASEVMDVLGKEEVRQDAPRKKCLRRDGLCSPLRLFHVMNDRVHS